MSTVTPTSESFDCNAPDCNVEYSPASVAHGSYCSNRCYYRHKGADVLRNVAQDQRWCATCFRQVKNIERPSQRLLDSLEPVTARAVIGRQYATETTVWAVDARDTANPYHPIEHQRWGCECGTVDPSTRSEILAEIDPETTVQSLWACLRELWREDNVAHEPSLDPYLEGIRDRRDWPQAIGRAIYCH